MANLTLQQYESLVPESYTGDKKVYLQLVKEKLVGQNLNTEHLQLFLYTAHRTGLDPLANQIYAVARKDWKTDKYNMTIQTGIDGFRVIAQRSGEYAGQDDAVFTVEELYNPVTKENEKDLKASVTVWKVVNGVKCPVTASARWGQYVQTDKDGNPVNLWKKMPHLMLAKVAEALALRKAFPNDLSGVYTSEEMAQADNPSSVQPSMPTQQADSEPIEGEIQESEPQKPMEATDSNIANYDAKMQSMYRLARLVLGSDKIETFKDETRAKYGVTYMHQLTEAQIDETIEMLEAERQLAKDSEVN